MRTGETPPTPIHTGIDIRLATVEDIRARALDQYDALVALLRDVQMRRDHELDQPFEARHPDRLAHLESIIANLEHVADDLDEILLGTIKDEDELRRRWMSFIERFESATKDSDPTETMD